MRRTLGLILIGMLLMAPQSAWALANPASVFCAKSGGKTEIRKGPRGQHGVCRLPDMGAWWTSGPTFVRCGQSGRAETRGSLYSSGMSAIGTESTSCPC
jgi:putative hemolysin